MKAPGFLFYANDFLVSTAAMSAEAVGGYIRLLCYQWSNGSIPNDKEKALRLAGCSADGLAEAWHKFGIDDDGNLRNARLESVRKERQDFIDGQALKAKKGWESRKNKGSALHSRKLANAKPEASQCQNDGLQSSSSSSSDKSTETHSSKSKASSESEVIMFCKSIGLPESDGTSSWNKWEGNGWTNGKAAIKDWKSTIRHWKAAGYMPSQKSQASNGNPLKPKSWTEMTEKEIMREVL